MDKLFNEKRYPYPNVSIYIHICIFVCVSVKATFDVSRKVNNPFRNEIVFLFVYSYKYLIYTLSSHILVKFILPFEILYIAMHRIVYVSHVFHNDVFVLQDCILFVMRFCTHQDWISFHSCAFERCAWSPENVTGKL